MLTKDEAAAILVLIAFAWQNGAVRSPEDAQKMVALQGKLSALQAAPVAEVKK